jgi:hypothetical protein
MDTGASQISATIVYVDFTIDGTGTMAMVPFTTEPVDTYSVVFRPETPLIEHLNFLTTINRSIGGIEERIACRKVPRKVFEHRIAEGRQHLESLFFTRTARGLALPHWHEPAYLSSVATAGDDHVHVGTTALSEFRAGGYALLWRSTTKYDTVLIASVTTTEITFDADNALIHSYPVGAQVLPLEPTYVQDITIDRQCDSSIYDIKFEMVPQDNDLGLNPYTDGELVLSEVNYCDGNLRESIAQEIYTVDSPSGSFEKTTIRDNSDRGMMLGFRTHNRTDLWALRELLYRLQGRKTSFYLVTFAKDLVPVAALTSGQTHLDIEYCGYACHVGVEREIRVVLHDGTTYSRSITAWQIVSSTKERLTVGVVWSATVQVADIDRIEYVDLVRLDTDDVVIEHQNALGWARCEVPVIRVQPPIPLVTGNPLGLMLLWTKE